jgi:hypothetical protein
MVISNECGPRNWQLETARTIEREVRLRSGRKWHFMQPATWIRTVSSLSSSVLRLTARCPLVTITPRGVSVQRLSRRLADASRPAVAMISGFGRS